MPAIAAGTAARLRMISGQQILVVIVLVRNFMPDVLCLPRRVRLKVLRESLKFLLFSICFVVEIEKFLRCGEASNILTHALFGKIAEVDRFLLSVHLCITSQHKQPRVISQTKQHNAKQQFCPLFFCDDFYH